jgi:hypothetical protein
MAWFEGKVEAITRGAYRTVSNAVEAGDEITKHHIETRGTAKSGKRGRIDSGAMRDLVDHETQLVSQDEVVGRFGWLGESPYWARYQELGTQYIEPMFALSDAAEEVGQDYLAEMRKVVRDA